MANTEYLNTWNEFEKLYKEGIVKSIGVSNFNIDDLQNLLKSSTIKPVINQVEIHPYNTQEELRKFCKNNNIQVEAYSPLGNGGGFEYYYLYYKKNITTINK